MVQRNYETISFHCRKQFKSKFSNDNYSQMYHLSFTFTLFHLQYSRIFPNICVLKMSSAIAVPIWLIGTIIMPTMHAILQCTRIISSYITCRWIKYIFLFFYFFIILFFIYSMIFISRAIFCWMKKVKVKNPFLPNMMCICENGTWPKATL